MTAMVTAFGISLDTIQITGISTRWWTLIAFVIFCAFVIWIIWDGYNNKKKLENMRPNILVEPIININNDWCLNVINNGEEGNFETQIALHAVFLSGDWVSTEEFSSWKGIWEYTNTNDIKIMKGHHESVKLVHITTRGTRPILELLGYDLNAKSAAVIKAFDTTLPSLSDIIVRILVVISSHPSPKNGVFEKTYEITPFDMVEIKPSNIKRFLRNIIRRNKL